MQAPSPPCWPLLGHIPAFRRDVLGLLVRAVREHGDVVRFHLGPRPVHLVNHPEAVHHVLRTHAANYDKDTRTSTFLRDVTGESLLTSNGDAWARRRHLFQPAFRRHAVEGFAGLMREEAERVAAGWRPGTEAGIPGAMMAVTFRVVARALFGSRLPDETVGELESPIAILLEESFARHGTLFGRISRRFREAKLRLDAAVASILARAEPGGDTPDLLSIMRRAGFTDAEIRNESVTFLVAGHETTANALTWLFAYLAHHPHCQAEAADDPAALDRALRETLRLAPPIWILERHAIESDEVAGFTLPAGGSVVVCPYTVHRHRDFWEDPEQFRPERFLAETPPAYLPFGLGPRFCIGREFALMEARIIAETLLERFRFDALSPAFPSPQPSITLRVRGPLALRLSART